MKAPRTPIPVTLALACALEDRGNLFSIAQEFARIQPAAALAPLGQLMCDIIAPLLDMGAIYEDGAGTKHIDRQAVCDFGIVACGLSRCAVMYEMSLHELALHFRRHVPRHAVAQAPSRDFLADMQKLFPDTMKEQFDDNTQIS